ncbi:MAG: hypothetical protein ACXVCH_00095 [Bdellovibrionota bacterium]
MKEFLKYLGIGALALFALSVLYFHNQAKNDPDFYIRATERERKPIQVSGFKKIEFGVKLADFKKHPPCPLRPVESEDPSVTVLGCQGTKELADSDSVGFYFIHDELLRIGFVYPETAVKTLTAYLVEQHGKPWETPRGPASAGNWDYMWGKDREIILRGGNGVVMVLLSSPEFEIMLNAAKLKKYDHNL